MRRKDDPQLLLLLLLGGGVLAGRRLLEDDETVYGFAESQLVRTNGEESEREGRTVRGEDLSVVLARRLVADALDREVGLDVNLGAASGHDKRVSARACGAERQEGGDAPLLEELEAVDGLAVREDGVPRRRRLLVLLCEHSDASALYSRVVEVSDENEDEGRDGEVPALIHSTASQPPDEPRS